MEAAPALRAHRQGHEETRRSSIHACGRFFRPSRLCAHILSSAVCTVAAAVAAMATAPPFYE
ncbi:unspecified product [Leishmania tarentolae]|uniref:Unspecified product n=1 Tax=Leishmania tarentolae TaxID=5689 RepID=A0A640KW93_LEITA|nr:unspecified product [Leishmania tarentolae]